MFQNDVEEIDAGGHLGVTIRGDIGENLLDFSATNLVGIERIEGRGSADTITGSAGADTIDGGGEDDVLIGGAGDDTFLVGLGGGSDLVTGGAGFDRILATADGTQIGLRMFQNDVEEIDAGGHLGVTIRGDIGENVLDFSATNLVGIERIEGGESEDRITGSSGADTIVGGNHNDILDGGAGDDTFLVGLGDDQDTVTGGAGFDRILATADNVAIGLRMFQNDVEEIDAGGHLGVTIRGDIGENVLDFSATNLVGIERIEGRGSADTITGSAGADTIDGGNHNDTLNGGTGNDTMIGGAGDDTFVFRTGYDNDTIDDLAAGAGSGDVIDLVGMGFADLQSVLNNASQVGSDTLIDFGGGDSLTLTGVNLADLHQDDFALA